MKYGRVYVPRLFPAGIEFRRELAQRLLVRGLEDEIHVAGPLIQGVTKAWEEFKMQVRLLPGESVGQLQGLGVIGLCLVVQLALEE